MLHIITLLISLKGDSPLGVKSCVWKGNSLIIGNKSHKTTNARWKTNLIGYYPGKPHTQPTSFTRPQQPTIHGAKYGTRASRSYHPWMRRFHRERERERESKSEREREQVTFESLKRRNEVCFRRITKLL